MTTVLIAIFLVIYHFLGDEGLQQRYMSSLILLLVRSAFGFELFQQQKDHYGWLAS